MDGLKAERLEALAASADEPDLGGLVVLECGAGVGQAEDSWIPSEVADEVSFGFGESEFERSVTGLRPLTHGSNPCSDGSFRTDIPGRRVGDVAPVVGAYSGSSFSARRDGASRLSPSPQLLTGGRREERAVQHPAPQPVKAVLAMRRTTIVDAARWIGVTPQYLSRIVNGWQKPSPRVRRDLAEILDCTEAELFRDQFLVTR